LPSPHDTSNSGDQIVHTSDQLSSGRASHWSRRQVAVLAPFRLDLAVSALRRLSNNLVDVYTADGCYLRALAGAASPIIVRVTQPRADSLSVAVNRGTDAALAVGTVRRMLGTDCNLRPFARQAAKTAWLGPLVARLRGMKPPRYPTLWEACVNAIVFQQISLHAASAIMRRLVTALGDSTEYDGIPLIAFPGAVRFLEASDAVVRAVGLSSGKAGTLRRMAEAIVSRTLTEEMLEARPSADAATVLRAIKGIGPWTASVILLRGLGRLDVFPLNDSGAAASIAIIAGRGRDVESIAEMLGAQRGMLYFSLLLGRLEARGEIGRASDVTLLSRARERAHDVGEYSHL
jgi:DNA-3-methyladenine glycosylase II